MSGFMPALPVRPDMVGRLSSSPFMRRKAAANYIEDQWGIPCSPAWLAKLAVVGGGPRFRKAGRFPLYAIEDLDHWASTRLGQLVSSTSELQ
ncbi:hypothetical protein ACLB6G_09440 [Zhengella sp. ZM62]|uniref:hypothetical protein n=1 Tax=Zhengella sedimenti TaxID=3390035 RepID=UPI003974B2D9